MKPRPFWGRWLRIAAIAFPFVVLLCNRWVINSTDAYVKTNSALLPDNEVGVILGTSSYASDGSLSADFQGRIDAAVELYKLGKIKRIIASGANPDSTYNEPRRMQEALIAAGVPTEAIELDFAGDRTLESLRHVRAVFGHQRFTVITQKYHTYRAIFISKRLGLKAAAYVAPGTTYRHPMREIFARTKAVFEIPLIKLGLS